MLDSKNIDDIRQKAQIIVNLDVTKFLLMIKERMYKIKKKLNGN